MDTSFRRAVSIKQQLAVSLRFLATGNSFRSFGFSFKLGFTPIVMPQPNKEFWLQVSEDYKNLWNFPNCIGALDGKHINIKCPINSGSDFYNYKGNYSVVLLVLLDAKYKFIAVDIGTAEILTAVYFLILN